MNGYEMTNYLTGTRDGERKRGKEKRKNANTNTPSPERANPWKGKGKEQADGRRAKHRPEEGGADGSAWHNLQGESQTYLGTRRTQTGPREGARMR